MCEICGAVLKFYCPECPNTDFENFLFLCMVVGFLFILSFWCYAVFNCSKFVVTQYRDYKKEQALRISFYESQQARAAVPDQEAAE